MHVQCTCSPLGLTDISRDAQEPRGEIPATQCVGRVVSFVFHLLVVVFLALVFLVFLIILPILVAPDQQRRRSEPREERQRVRRFFVVSGREEPEESSAAAVGSRCGSICLRDLVPRVWGWCALRGLEKDW